MIRLLGNFAIGAAIWGASYLIPEGWGIRGGLAGLGGFLMGSGTVTIFRELRARWQNPARICAREGHDWQSYGGRNAGCCADCCCSVPVHECARCGDCDYGDNAEARAKLESCELAIEVRSCICQGGYDQPSGIAYRCNDCPVHGEEPIDAMP